MVRIVDSFKKLYLKSGKDEAIRRFHPWVFSGAIRNTEGTVSEGDMVKVFSNGNEFLGIGHFQPETIAVRIFSFFDEEPSVEFWRKKVENALMVRKSAGLMNNETNVVRLIHGEGDGLPGLIADLYNGVLVLQFHSVGMYMLREMFTRIFTEIFGERLVAVYDKSSRTLPFKAGTGSTDGFLLGDSGPVMVCENGLIFKIDFAAGQKTGFFIDQRDNRELLEKYSSGRDVLNLFSYTGGFSLYALRGGARLVHGVDSSSYAVNLEKENVNLNFPDDSRYKGFKSDVAEFLRNIKDKYDLIVIDPPAFSKHRDSLHKALQAYMRMNAKAVENIRSRGIIFTFSCSQVVTPKMFREAVFSAATLAGRQVRILHQLVQPPDHPVSIYHPEGEYLKGLVLYVE